jgi:hypothetical protein
MYSVDLSIEDKEGIQPSLILFLLFAVFSGFNYLLSALFSSKIKAKEFFLGPVLASN